MWGIRAARFLDNMENDTSHPGKRIMASAPSSVHPPASNRRHGSKRQSRPQDTHDQSNQSHRRPHRDHRATATGRDLPYALLATTGATPFVTAEHTLAPYRRSKGLYVPLLCDLASTSVTEATENAATLVTRLDLYPGKTKKLIKTYAKIAAWSAKHGIEQLADLVDATAAQLITDLAGVSDLHPQPSTSGSGNRINQGAHNTARAAAARDRRRIHHVHNAVVSLRSATVLTRTRTRKERVTDDSLAYGLPTLPCLEDRKGRPLTDEEILLARLLVEIDHAEGALPRPLVAYLIGECGIRPMESAILETSHLDDPASPSKVNGIPGVWEFGERTVKLTDYAAATLPRLLAQLRAGNQPLTYTGSAPRDPKAHASLSDVIKRHLRRAGVVDSEVTAKSLNLWRVQHTLVRRDFRKARKYHGGRTVNVLADLKLFANENDADQDVVHLQRLDNEDLIATVKTADFYDPSFTDKGRWRRLRNYNL